MKELFQSLVSSKNTVWTKDKGGWVYFMNEIAEYFARNRNIGKQYIYLNYAGSFKQIGEKIDNLNYKHLTVEGRTIKSIIQALMTLRFMNQLGLISRLSITSKKLKNIWCIWLEV